MRVQTLSGFARAAKRLSAAPVSWALFYLGEALSMSGEGLAEIGNEMMDRANARLARKARR